MFVFRCSDVHLLQHLQDLLIIHLRLLRLTELNLWETWCFGYTPLQTPTAKQSFLLHFINHRLECRRCAVMLSQYGRVHTSQNRRPYGRSPSNVKILTVSHRVKVHSRLFTSRTEKIIVLLHESWASVYSTVKSVIHRDHRGKWAFH